MTARTLCAFISIHEPPEGVVVAGDQQMGEFVDEHVVDDLRRAVPQPGGQSRSRVDSRIERSCRVHDPQRCAMVATHRTVAGSAAPSK